MTEKHKCIHDEQIRMHDLKITELTTRSKYKEHTIMEIKDELKIIKDSIATLNDNVNQLILQSTKDDDKLELELTTLKTQIKNLKREINNKEEESNKRINRILVIVGLVFTALTICLNITFKFI